MAQVKIVTDSSAVFEDTTIIEDHDVSVVPLRIQIGNKVYKDGVDIDTQEVFARMESGHGKITILPPTVEDFDAVYQKLNRSTDQICVLVNSHQLTETFTNAQVARSELLGRCEIAVIDSQSVSAGLGFLVEAILEATFTGSDLEEVVRVARGTVPKIYSVYYVDSLNSIQRSGLIGETQAILGTMLQIKPILTIEEGSIMTMEKVRTHSQAVDRMIEFVTEFTHVERLSITQSTLRTTDRTRMLQDRLALEFGKTHHPVNLYSPLLASKIGADAVGLALYEGNIGDNYY